MTDRGQNARPRADDKTREDLRTTTRPKADVRDPANANLPRDEGLREFDEALEGLRRCRDTIPDDLWKMAGQSPSEDPSTNVTIPAPPPPLDEE